MRNIDNITLAVIALIGKDRAWKTAAGKRGKNTIVVVIPCLTVQKYIG